MGKAVAEQLGLITWLRATAVFRGYDAVMRPERKQHWDQECQFFGALFARLPKLKLAFDIGAANGEKTSVFLACGARVVAVEPTPVSAAYLRSVFRRTDGVTVIEKAVSDSQDLVNLYVVDRFGAMSTISEKCRKSFDNGPVIRSPDGTRPKVSSTVQVQTVTLDSLVNLYGLPDFIKIDVEGHEQRVLSGLSQPVPLVSFEANLPEFKQETIACIRRLDELDPKGRYNYREHGDFLMQEWVSGDAMRQIIAKTQLQYMELYCCSNIVHL